MSLLRNWTILKLRSCSPALQKLKFETDRSLAHYQAADLGVYNRTYLVDVLETKPASLQLVIEVYFMTKEI